ncbi:MAG: glycosyltransferase [Cyclobacteriaceae bacterium]|nr:glycosyltransferase [Cyclobacteriaceae bacterium]
MMVSVIIPCYNSAYFIEDTIKSALCQTYSDIEVIVVDDGSTDNSIEIIKKYPVQLIQQKNAGACAARNRGFAVSKGDFIQYLDADDLLSPNKIADQVAQLNGRNDIISNGKWGRFYTSEPLREEIKWGPHTSIQKDLSPVDWLCQNRMSQTSCWFTPRKLIEKAGAWDETLHQNQDGEFFTRVIAQATEVKYCETAKVYYRSGLNNSITSNIKGTLALKSFYKTCISFEKTLLPLEDSTKTRLAVANMYQEFVYRAYPYCQDLIKTSEQKISTLGGSSLPPYKKGKLHNLLMDIFGWKFPTWLKYNFS